MMHDALNLDIDIHCRDQCNVGDGIKLMGGSSSCHHCQSRIVELMMQLQLHHGWYPQSFILKSNHIAAEQYTVHPTKQ
eukprot:677414-Amphidinium_carterae.1